MPESRGLMEEPRWMWPGRLRELCIGVNQGPQTSKGRKAGRPKGAKTMTVFFLAPLEISIERKKTGVAFCRPRAQLPTIFPDKITELGGWRLIGEVELAAFLDVADCDFNSGFISVGDDLLMLAADHPGSWSGILRYC